MEVFVSFGDALKGKKLFLVGSEFFSLRVVPPGEGLVSKCCCVDSCVKIETKVEYAHVHFQGKQLNNFPWYAYCLNGGHPRFKLFTPLGRFSLCRE